jgi:hypothetical protein
LIALEKLSLQWILSNARYPPAERLFHCADESMGIQKKLGKPASKQRMISRIQERHHANLNRAEICFMISEMEGKCNHGQI